MKNIFAKTLLMIMAGAVIGCDRAPKPAPSKVSLNDGIRVNGAYVTVAEFRNTTALDMIIGCMRGRATERDYCQCAVDNTFLGMTGDQILDRDANHYIIPRGLETKKMCNDSSTPRDKIPKTMQDGNMLGGEIYSFLSKEITLDCMVAGHAENACRCFADGVAQLPKNKMEYLKIIDTRTRNMFEYAINDSAIADDVTKFGKKCGIK